MECIQYLMQQGAQSGDTTYRRTQYIVKLPRRSLSANTNLQQQVEVTSGTTSATSISKSSCYGINVTMQDQNRPCQHDSDS